MIYTYIGIALMAYPLILALKKYGGNLDEALEKLYMNLNIQQILHLRSVWFLGYGLYIFGLFKVVVLHFHR